MSLTELFILAVGLSMDAFAVSMCKGLALRRADAGSMLKAGAYFGGFQAGMPLLGYFLGSAFSDQIVAIDHWIAFFLLGYIGFNMIRESQQEDEACDDDMGVKTMTLMAIATSIDALAVGISLAMAGNVNIWMAALFIGICTCGFSAVGVKIGNVFGSRFEKKAQMAGGIILILLGAKILLEHLGILA